MTKNNINSDVERIAVALERVGGAILDAQIKQAQALDECLISEKHRLNITVATANIGDAINSLSCSVFDSGNAIAEAISQTDSDGGGT